MPFLLAFLDKSNACYDSNLKFTDIEIVIKYNTRKYREKLLKIKIKRDMLDFDLIFKPH